MKGVPPDFPKDRPPTRRTYTFSEVENTSFLLLPEGPGARVQLPGILVPLTHQNVKYKI